MAPVALGVCASSRANHSEAGLGPTAPIITKPRQSKIYTSGATDDKPNVSALFTLRLLSAAFDTLGSQE